MCTSTYPSHLNAPQTIVNNVPAGYDPRYFAFRIKQRIMSVYVVAAVHYNVRYEY